MRFPLQHHAHAVCVARRFAEVLHELSGGVGQQRTMPFGPPVLAVAQEDDDPMSLVRDMHDVAMSDPSGGPTSDDLVADLRLRASSVLPKRGAGSSWHVETPVREWVSALSWVAAEGIEHRREAEADELAGDVAGFVA